MRHRLLLPLALFICAITTDRLWAEDAKKDSKKDTMQLLKTFRDEFIAVTPGKGRFPANFEMGTATGDKTQQPAHKVTLRTAFHIAKYEVPQNLWEAVMGSNPSRWKGPRNSVEMLSLDEAIAFCEKATLDMRKAKLIGAKQAIRLPSEAE